MPKSINGQMQINGITDGSIENIFSAVSQSLAYIGADPTDFALANSMFSRPKHSPMHGIGHIYRTMIGCALLGELLQKPREGLLAFCGAYIHDLPECTMDVILATA